MHVVDFEKPGPPMDRVFHLGPIPINRPRLQMQPTLGLRTVVPAPFTTFAGLGTMRTANAEVPL